MGSKNFFNCLHEVICSDFLWLVLQCFKRSLFWILYLNLEPWALFIWNCQYRVLTLDVKNLLVDCNCYLKMFNMILVTVCGFCPFCYNLEIDLGIFIPVINEVLWYTIVTWSFEWFFIDFCLVVSRGSVYRALGFMVAASPCALAVAPLAYATAISACARKVTVNNFFQLLNHTDCYNIPWSMLISTFNLFNHFWYHQRSLAFNSLTGV